MKVHYKKDTKEIWGYYPNEYGDIPTPNIEISDEAWQKATSEGATHINPKTKELFIPPKELSPEEILANLKTEFVKSIDGILNKVAQSKGYDDIISARSYAGYDNPFRAESEAFGKWSADVWQWAYALQDKVVKGEVDVSNLSIDNVLKDMPQAPSFGG